MILAIFRPAPFAKLTCSFLRFKNNCLGNDDILFFERLSSSKTLRLPNASGSTTLVILLFLRLRRMRDLPTDRNPLAGRDMIRFPERSKLSRVTKPRRRRPRRTEVMLLPARFKWRRPWLKIPPPVELDEPKLKKRFRLTKWGWG